MHFFYRGTFCVLLAVIVCSINVPAIESTLASRLHDKEAALAENIVKLQHLHRLVNALLSRADANSAAESSEKDATVDNDENVNDDDVEISANDANGSNSGVGDEKVEVEGGAQGDDEINSDKRSASYLRFGKRGPSYLRFGRGQSYLRFGKRAAGYLRFGKRSDAHAE